MRGETCAVASQHFSSVLTMQRLHLNPPPPLQYLQYKNVRPDYLKEIWKVINWKDVAQRLAAAKA